MSLEEDFRRLFTNAQFMTRDHVRFVRLLLDELIRARQEVAKVRGGKTPGTLVPPPAQPSVNLPNAAQIVKMREEVQKLTDDIIRLKGEEKKHKEQLGELQSNINALNKDIRTKEKDVARLEGKQDALSGHLVNAVENVLDALKNQGITTRKKKPSASPDVHVVSDTPPASIAPTPPPLNLQALRDRAQETQQLQTELRAWSSVPDVAVSTGVSPSPAVDKPADNVSNWWDSLSDDQKKVVLYVRKQKQVEYSVLLTWAIEEQIMLDGTMLMLNDASDEYGLPHALTTSDDESWVHAADYLSHPSVS